MNTTTSQHARRSHARLSTSSEEDLALALGALNSLISSGWEYPDAHTKVVLKHGVEGDALSAAYDSCSGQHPQHARPAELSC